MAHTLHFEKARKPPNPRGMSRWCWMNKEYTLYFIHTLNDARQKCSVLSDLENNVLLTIDDWPQVEEVWPAITTALQTQNITCLPLPLPPQVVEAMTHQLCQNSTSSGATPL